jgi:hypothetical protein
MADTRQHPPDGLLQSHHAVPLHAHHPTASVGLPFDRPFRGEPLHHFLDHPGRSDEYHHNDALQQLPLLTLAALRFVLAVLWGVVQILRLHQRLLLADSRRDDRAKSKRIDPLAVLKLGHQ